MESKKTHYRKVFKSDHLGSADLEEFLEDGKKLIFTIKEVRAEFGAKVAGKTIDANIAYFTDAAIKPLVLNATNSKQVAKFAGSKFVEDWTNILIELYVDTNVRMKGQTVEGVRIKSVQPNVKKELTPGHDRWGAAKAAVKAGKLDGVLNQFVVSPENIKLLQE